MCQLTFCTENKFNLFISPFSLSLILITFNLVCSSVNAAESVLVMNEEPVIAQENQFDEVEFDNIFFKTNGGGSVDISRYSKGNYVPAGFYYVDIYANNVLVGRSNVEFKEVGANKAIRACINRELLLLANVDLTKLSDAAISYLDKNVDNCPQVYDIITSATLEFDSAEQRLDISVPNIYLNSTARDLVDVALWDNGITAAVLNYNANIYNINTDFDNITTSYLSLNSKFNYGAWRFRYDSSITSNEQSTEYQSLQLNAQRGLNDIRSQLTIGQTFSDGSIFDGYGFTGLKLASDQSMQPLSKQGYAPTIRGEANSNAHVRILQDGRTLYETNVAPGPFEINDLYATGYNGDLTVEITEADGTQRLSTVAFSNSVVSLREGHTRYSLLAGQYRGAQLDAAPYVVEGTAYYGLNNYLTLFGGGLVADNYFSMATGASLNTEIGAFSFDITGSQMSAVSPYTAELEDLKGISARLSYSKNITPTGTNISLGAYRYSSEDFYTFSEAVNYQNLADISSSDYLNPVAKRKGRLQVYVNQSLGDNSSLYLNGYSQDYWHSDDRDNQFQIGYNSSYKRLNYSTSISRQFNSYANNWENNYSLSLSMPLGTGRYMPRSSTTLSYDAETKSTRAVESITGNFGEESQFNYGLGVQTAFGSGDTSNTDYNMSLGYSGSSVSLAANASQSDSSTQSGASVSGSLVIWDNGVAFSSYLGDTIAVIEADEVAGLKLSNGGETNSWGRGAAGGLVPYRQNAVSVDPQGLPLHIEVKSTQQTLVPTNGAVVRARFETEDKGRSVLFKLEYADGKAVPFGAEVLDATGQYLATVGQGSRVLVSGFNTLTGQFVVKWGESANEQCHFSYQLPDTTQPDSIRLHLDKVECLVEQASQHGNSQRSSLI